VSRLSEARPSAHPAEPDAGVSERDLQVSGRERTGAEDSAGVVQLTYLEAISDALRSEMRRDDTVFCLGEDIGAFGERSR
jgi:hypothetical protein